MKGKAKQGRKEGRREEGRGNGERAPLRKGISSRPEREDMRGGKKRYFDLNFVLKRENIPHPTGGEA